MNTGIQDGYALGRAFTTGQLDGYEAQRRPVAQRVVAFTDRMTRIATTRSMIARTARNIALPILGHLGLRTKIATELAELNYPIDRQDSSTPPRMAPAADPAAQSLPAGVPGSNPRTAPDE